MDGADFVDGKLATVEEQTPIPVRRHSEIPGRWVKCPSEEAEADAVEHGDSVKIHVYQQPGQFWHSAIENPYQRCR